jgi:serine/threonine-protein kinase
VIAEYGLRRRRDPSLGVQEYLQRFPRYRDQLPGWLAACPPAPDSGQAAGGRPAPAPRTEPEPKPNCPYIPGYEIVGELGRGAAGIVYKARQLSLNRLVALKTLRAGVHATPEQLVRFRSEAQAVARLQHPNIVQVHEVGEHEGLCYFSLEYVDGGSLAQKLNGAPQAPRPSARLAETLARAVHFAHENQVIHRDLKPANILLSATPRCSWPLPADADASTAEYRPQVTDFGLPKVTDFGLAKRLDEEGSHTEHGIVMGTALYMAPEQAQGDTHLVGPVTDVYALGGILYELLTGQPPFKGRSLVDILAQVKIEDPVAPSRLQPNIPRDLETICLTCLQKEQAKRYASAHDLASDLRSFLAGEPIRARRPSARERVVQWARRHPAMTVADAAGALALLGLVIGLVSPLTGSPMVFSSLLVLGSLAGSWFYSVWLRRALKEIARQREVAERQVERLHLLLEMTRQLVSTTDLDTLLRLISVTTARLADADRATIYLADPERRELRSKIALGEGVGEIRVPFGEGFAGEVAVSGRVIVTPDAYADPRFNPDVDKRTGYRTRNLLTLPMRAQDGEVLGVFQVLNKRDGCFSSGDVEMLSVLAASAAVAVENARRQTGTPK